MSSRRKLTPTSYLVLGLAAQRGPVTSYELKQHVQASIGYFWTFPHSQLYAEPERLVEAGLLASEQEATGRRRRRFTITDAGRDELSQWLAEPPESTTEIRDLGLLKLFFGSLAEPGGVAGLAKQQRDLHAQRLASFEKLGAEIRGADPHARATLEMGLRFEAMVIEFWSDIGRRARGES